ncbi:Heme A synthase, cytochrome oxidase biogenesis protein Cox15-CtaA, partial [hydrothermal vent metagenome]
MTSVKYQPVLYRYAIATTFVALLAMGIGALVTTKNAGMAFRDWPNSDGHNMLLYPWLKSAGDKFLEHGHRLAGMLIGLFSIGLVAMLSWKESRPKVRLAGWMILGAVIVQGLLG